MKMSWKGSLSFGLVDIPIELYAAIQPHSIGFKLLHAKCHTPISYLRWCTTCNQKVEWTEIDKGIQLKDGTFFIATPEALKELRPEKTEAISILEFVGSEAIDPILYDKHYYVLPAKKPYISFFLFAAALGNLNKVAIGQFVLRDKEHICAIRIYKQILLLTTLNYEYEIKKLARIENLEIPEMNTAELKLAKMLITKLSKKTFDISKFKDSFATNLIKKIMEYQKGGLPPSKKKALKEEPQPPTLLTALEKSIYQTEASGTKKVKPSQ